VIARHVQQAFGVPCVEVRACFQLYGGFNGGTMASMLNLLAADPPVRLDDPFLLDPPISHSPRQTERWTGSAGQE
jgi:hypothetical protein